MSLFACEPAARREEKSLLSEKKSFGVTNTLAGVFTQPRASPALRHVAAVTGNTHLPEPPLFRLQVNGGKFYANVTFS